jgi:hypothetical protein
MNFSTDRDLLALEPQLFHDIAWLGQQRVNVTDATLVGTTLTSTEADFISAKVEAGSVVLIDDLAHEVIGRIDADTLEVSLLRARLGDPAIPGPEVGPATAVVRSFEPQAASVHDGLLRLLGINPDSTEVDTLTEDAVVSLTAMARLESLGTLERIYSAAATLTTDHELLTLKANEYRRRFRSALNAAVVHLDTDGDGFADQRVRPGQVRLVRV